MLSVNITHLIIGHLIQKMTRIVYEYQKSKVIKKYLNIVYKKKKKSVGVGVGERGMKRKKRKYQVSIRPDPRSYRTQKHYLKCGTKCDVGGGAACESRRRNIIRNTGTRISRIKKTVGIQGYVNERIEERIEV